MAGEYHPINIKKYEKYEKNSKMNKKLCLSKMFPPVLSQE
jgi:hypothetical protein